MMKDKFWMVWLEGTRGPAYQHETYAGALTEAKRLTEVHGKASFVLEAISGYEPPPKVQPIYVSIALNSETMSMRIIANIK